MSIHKMYSMKTEIKTNTSRTFLTNDELYHLFSIKCRKNKQRIGDRLNALIAADLNISVPFDNKENKNPEETSACSEI